MDVDQDKIQKLHNFQLQLRMSSILRSLTLVLLMVLILLYQEVWVKLDSFALKTWCYLSFPFHFLISTLFVTMSYRTKMTNLQNCRKIAFLIDLLMLGYGLYGIILRNSQMVIEFEGLTDSSGMLVFVIQAMAIVSGGPMIFTCFQLVSVSLKSCMMYLFECRCVPPLAKKKRNLHLTFSLRRHKRPFTQTKHKSDAAEATCPICMLGF